MRNFVSESLSNPDSPVAGPSKAILAKSNQDTEVDEVIADMTLTAVKECLTPSEAAAVDAATKSLPPASSPSHPMKDESILMPPPDGYVPSTTSLPQYRWHVFFLWTTLTLDFLGPSLASMGIFSSTIEKEEPSKKDIVPVDSGELDLAGIDDAELDGYIKNEDEAKMTENMWMALNGEFMKELEGNSCEFY